MEWSDIVTELGEFASVSGESVSECGGNAEADMMTGLTIKPGSIMILSVRGPVKSDYTRDAWVHICG
eukprot:9503923-Pyramimonas_sp.AAC.2